MPTKIHRRSFLGLLGTGALGLAFDPARLFAGTGDLDHPPQLIFLQLTGGNDALNTVIPRKDPLYRHLRKDLGVAGPTVLSLTEELGFHPELSPLMSHFEQGHLAVLPAVGSPRPNLSHFRSLDNWHAGRVDLEHPNEGFVGRALRESKETHIDLFHVGEGPSPLMFRGAPRPVVSLNSLDDLILRTPPPRGPRSRRNEGAKSDLLRRLEAAQTQARAMNARLERAKKATRASRYPAFPLARRLAVIASLIATAEQPAVYFVEQGGFDTHASQDVAHPVLLRSFAHSIAGFLADLRAKNRFDSTCIAVFSDFGRRAQENASRGTDHGKAGPMFLAGGRIRGGVIGHPYDLEHLDEGDLVMDIDYRSVQHHLMTEVLSLKNLEDPSERRLAQSILG